MSDPVDARLASALAGTYRLIRELGHGGMATVYLAEDLKHRRQVAIKVLNPELAAALGATRFTQEIEIAARLQHPHILGVFDSGEADGFLYYVMPYVEGESLRERLTRQGELPVTDAVRLLGEIADALGHAHARGVVHRDIKPENVMSPLDPGDRPGRVPRDVPRRHTGPPEPHPDRRDRWRGRPSHRSVSLVPAGVAPPR